MTDRDKDWDKDWNKGLDKGLDKGSDKAWDQEFAGFLENLADQMEEAFVDLSEDIEAAISTCIAVVDEVGAQIQTTLEQDLEPIIQQLLQPIVDQVLEFGGGLDDLDAIDRINDPSHPTIFQQPWLQGSPGTSPQYGTASYLLPLDHLLGPWQQPLVPTRTPPAVCVGCQHYHGHVYGGQVLVCGMHPYGMEADQDTCPDKEPREWPQTRLEARPWPGD